MALEIVRRIRGNVHDSIDVSELENAVLTHPFVQRMRRIKQLAFLHYAFPGATHTRFEHVLGVMHLAGVAWDKLKANQKRLARSCERFDNFLQREMENPPDGIIHGLLSPTFVTLEDLFRSDYILQVIRLAGLLHDLGHPPFSHSGERFLPSWGAVVQANDSLPSYLSEYLNQNILFLQQEGKDPDKEKISHETMSVLMIEKVMTWVYKEFPKLKMRVEPRDVISVLCSDIEPHAGSILHKNNIYCLCRELLSGELDIDRMDYLLRDSKECGVVYGIFDAGRIFDSLCLYYNPLDCGFHVGLGVGGLPAFEDYLRARHSMYLQLYFHKTSVAAEAMFEYLSELLGGFTLPAQVDEYAEFDEFCIGPILLKLVEDSMQGDKLQLAKQLIRDLLYDRRLWKRVYEITTKNLDEQSKERLFRVRQYIEQRGFRFKLISSVGVLTSFHPRGHREHSRNYLRLIKKDELQFLRVYPIEDYSSIIGANDVVSVHRIYCDTSIDPITKIPANEQLSLELAEMLSKDR